MKLEVNYDPVLDVYSWRLWDGPDGIDEYSGGCSCLGEVFEQVVVARAVNGLSYCEVDND
jgi:hypothetical protein